MRTKTCAYHCRACGGHFTSLVAFDAHKPRNLRQGGCEWPEDAPLVEAGAGECRIGGATPTPATLWEHESAERARERFAA